MTSADVFLSYNRADTASVRAVQARLREAGLATFLDREQLIAGKAWQPALEQGIGGCGAVAVFVGPSGLGTWQRREVQLALDRQAEEERAGQHFPVIPVLLPAYRDPPGGFLKLVTWVDLSADLADPAQLDLLLAGIRGVAPADGSAIREAVCPYRGLLAFREEDAGLFFGRDEAVKALADRLHDQSLVTLVGRSGSGKSSVVFAGLIPQLRRRIDGRSWAVMSLRPGPDPLHALVRTFDPPPPDLPPFEADHRVEKQVGILREDVSAIGRRIRALLAAPEERGTDRLLLYVDQFEELYAQALRNPGLDAKQAEADVARFIDLLLDAARTSPCTVVLTVRADFYGDLLKHETLAAAVPAGQVNLGPMRREDIEAAIVRPAEAVGLTVDPPLLDILLDEVCTSPGKLPLLEYALKETWEQYRNGDAQHRAGRRLTLNDYGKAGGIDGAIAKRANEIFAHLKPAEQAAARRLFVSLVTPGEGREDTRARAVYPEDDAIRTVVREFSAADARLLVTGEDTPSAQRQVEISHEALIREWDQLKGWVETNRKALRRRDQIRARMHEWQQHDQDKAFLLPPGLPLEEGRQLLDDHGDVLIGEIEPYIAASLRRDRQRIRRRRGLVLGIMAVLAGAGGFAGRQWLIAREQARIAAEQRNHAERNLGLAQRAANGLVFDLTQGLKSVSGISNDTVRRILSRADDLLTELAGGEDASPAMLHLRIAALDEFTQAYMAQGDLGAALATAEQAREIAAGLVSSDPGNASWQRDLSVSWNKLGDVRRAQGDLAGALQAYEQSQAIRTKLAAADPGNASWQRDLSVSWERIGDVRSAQGDLALALQAYEQSQAIAAKLAAADPGNAEWQRDLIVSHWRLADLLERLPERTGEAGTHWAEALRLTRALADSGRLAPTDAYFMEALQQRLAASEAQP